MRSEYKAVKVKKEVWEILTEDREHFQNKYPDKGNWSIGDTILEYKKRLGGLEDE